MKILIVFAFLFSIGFVLTADAYVEVNYTDPNNPLENYELDYEFYGVTFTISDQINSTNWTTIISASSLSRHGDFCLAENTVVHPVLLHHPSNTSVRTWEATSLTIPLPSEDVNMKFMFNIRCIEPGHNVGLSAIYLNYDFDRSDYDDRMNPFIPTLNKLNTLYANLTASYSNLKQIIGQENIQIKNYQEQKYLEIQQIEQKYNLLIANTTADATVKKNKIQTEQIDPLTISANATKHQLIALNGGTLPSGVIFPILD